MTLKRERLAQQRRMVGQTQESLAEKLGVDRTTVIRWERAESTPQPWVRPGLAEALQVTPQQLDEFLVDNRQGDRPPSDGSRSERRADTTVDSIGRAADTLTNDPLLITASMSRDCIQSLQHDMAVLARTANMAAFDVFTSVRQLCTEARTLAERARRPHDLADLYVVLGQGTALMASTAFDLGYWNESAALARAANQYADLAGHASLMAWTLGLQMTLANWRNEPDAALAYFAKAMSVAPDGEPRLRLRHIASRSYALLGSSPSLKQALRAAHRDRDLAAKRPDDLSASFGGEFAFGPVRAAACAAAAWLDLGDGEEAAKCAQEAVDAYTQLPPARRPYSQINGIKIDLAAAYLGMSDRDAAVHTLGDVLTLPPEKRNTSLTGRMTRVRHVLGGSPWTHDHEARQLAEAVSGWLTDKSPVLLN
ncbi:helix-turn-helix transcriptional regulator [Micromonospora aurantiaca (nom. illeg.)]|uniref:helix-turn-helix transcriptional regulator n=1 Tax=Micromonospora aurantiaca (nom. illeg.) TaxID=47850 RepID=UPI0033CF6D7C